MKLNPPVNCQVTYILRRASITENTIADIMGVVPSDQRDQIMAGTDISVVYFDNLSHSVRGTITIWHDRGISAICFGDGSIWGEWHESEELVVTEVYEGDWTNHGEEITGRIAYDLYGLKGILSCGEFFAEGMEGYFAKPASTISGGI